MAADNFLVNVAELCSSAQAPDEFAAATPGWLLQAPGVVVALVLRRGPSGVSVLAQAGSDVDAAPEVLHPLMSQDYAGAVPPAWAAASVAEVATALLGDDLLVVGRGRAATDAAPDLAPAIVMLEQTGRALQSASRLQDLRTRVDNAQMLANMGDYDWHIPTDTNTWSDHLFRIYGHEPQSFNASYERFLSMLHPDDRERIQGVHQEAYATGEPFQMIERVVRPDGELRYLSSNGQVLRDESGTPVRMRGTCVDITDVVIAEREAEQMAFRFRALVETSPDAVLVVDREGAIVQANGRATSLFGSDPVGSQLRKMITGEQIEGLDVPGQTLAGRPLRLDLVPGRVAGDDENGPLLTALFIRDARPRLEQQSSVAKLREAQVRRRQALELNDSVVQGLTSAILAHGNHEFEEAMMYLDRTMASARRMMNEWLEPLDGADLQPGDLLRMSASNLDDPGSILEPRIQLPRVLIVDDNDDVRRLLRIQLEATGRYAVVGEGGDGEQGITLADELQPDVVLLDLAMPVMDGLQALPLIKKVAPEAKVIVLSGFDQAAMREHALAAGAAKYVEKGVRMGLPQHIDAVLLAG